MSILVNMVDKTNVNYEDTFSYKIGVSFSDIENEIEKVRVVTFIPSYLDYFIPQCDSDFVIVEEVETEGGTNVTFNFGGVEFNSLAMLVRIQCRYKYPATQTSYESIATMYINDDELPIAESVAQVVDLVLNSNFTVSKTVYIPNTDPAPGGFVVWELKLQNLGDKGAPISNFTIKNDIPSIITLAQGWQIPGRDTSEAYFADTSFDGVVATSISEDGKSFNFDLNGTYTGTEYTIVVVGLIDENAQINQYADFMLWSADGVKETQTVAPLSIISPTSTVQLNSSTPLYVKIGNYYSWLLTFQNTGNVGISDVVFTIDVPPGLTPVYFKTGTYGIPEVSFFPSIEYSMTFVMTNDLEEVIEETIMGFDTTVSSTIDTNDLEIPEGYALTNVRINISNLVAGMQTIISPEAFAIVNNFNPETTSMQNHTQVEWVANGEQNQATVSSTTNINENVSLIISNQKYHEDLIEDTVVVHETIKFSATIQCPDSYVYEPILVEYLSSNIDYVGNERYIYYNYETNTTYDSDISVEDFPLPILAPEITILADGSRVVRFSYTGENSFDLKQRDTLTIEFNAEIIKNSLYPRQVSNYMFLGNYGPDGSIGGNSDNFPDSYLDFDGDGFTVESLAKSNTVYLTILYTPGFSTQTKIKGTQNLNFVDGIIPIRSRSGEEVTYRLIITNDRQKDLFNTEIIDIIPYIEDSAILNPLIPRGSGFGCEFVGVTARVDSFEDEDVPTFTATYCEGTNPIRFDSLNQLIGEEAWINTSSELTKSIKLTQDEVPFKPGQTITIDVTVKTPTEKDPEAIAYNTFAVRSGYYDQDKTFFMLSPTEPFKKGVRGIGAKSINGIVFEDTNGSGIYNSSAKGINKVVVSLYDQTGQKLSETMTDSLDALDGYYSFGDLSDGNYYLLFSIDDRKYIFTQQVKDNDLGSKPNKYGFTEAIEINEQMIDISIYAGLVNVAINNVLKVNKEAGKMVRNTLYSTMALDMKLNDLIDGFSLGK